jgi:acid phosphatase
MLSSIILALALSGSNVALAATSTSYASRPTFSTIEPSLASIYATQATATSLSPLTNVKGAAFDRIVQIWLENTVSQICLEFKTSSANGDVQDYDKAAADPNMQWLASQGILLTNFWATTHPSEP